MALQKDQDINTISTFLSHPQIPSLINHPPVDSIILLGCSVLHSTTILFRTLTSNPAITKTLVLCGGIGHSTSLIYEAVARHKTYYTIKDEVIGLPEAQVLEKILYRFFDVEKITSGGCKIILEDKSTNCGSNASSTLTLFNTLEIPQPKTCIIIQDPTMSLRTILSFQKIYADFPTKPEFLSCPVFIPQVKGVCGELRFGCEVEEGELWEMNRFLDLVVGEIKRLRDDENGYGPKGKGFIGHVDIPIEVEEAWGRLNGVLGGTR